MLCTIDNIGSLEFVDFSGDETELVNKTYKYTIETEYGVLYVYNETVFRFTSRNDATQHYFQLTNCGSFTELITPPDYPYLSLKTQFVLHNSGFNVFTFNVATQSNYKFTTIGSLNNTSRCVIRVYSQSDRQIVYETQSAHPIDEMLVLEQGQYFVVVELIDANDQAVIFITSKVISEQ